MHVVVDASLLAGALIDSGGSIGHRYRERLIELVGDDQAYVMRTLTRLEVVAALRNQLHRSERSVGGSGLLTEEHCDRAVKSMASWPFRRIDLTQPMLMRVWEMRNNLTPYDAMYVAATEVIDRDDRNGNAADLDRDPSCVGLLERQAGREREDVDPLRLATELYDHVGILEVSCAEAEASEAEVIERLDDSRGVVRVRPHPAIEVWGEIRRNVDAARPV